VPIVAAAVCPHPPLLIPEVATGAAAELDHLRDACTAAIDELAAARPDALLLVGSGADKTWYGADAGGSFAAYGAPAVEVDLGAPRQGTLLPLSLLVGAWLVRRSKTVDLPRTALSVPADALPADCLALGKELAARPERLALLVMGDGSARRSEHSPVHLHPRAELFDTTVAKALGSADTDVLAALDPELAAELQAAGRAPWQVLAGTPGPWRAELRYDAAPYGVGYFVASWRP
jgi:hypothetical protein